MTPQLATAFRHVFRLHEAISSGHPQIPGFRQSPFRSKVGIHAIRLHFADIGHLPHEHRRHRHYLVVDLIIIAVHGKTHVIRHTPHTSGPSCPYVPLSRLFRTQAAVPNEQIIEGIESRDTEYVFIRRAQTPTCFFHRPPRQAHRRGKPLTVVGRSP